MNRALAVALTVNLGLAAATACGDDEKEPVTTDVTDTSATTRASATTEVDGEQVDTFTFRFSDSSVPPEYHRSWTVEMSADGAGTYVVDSYGDVISEGTVELDDETWSRMLATIPDVDGEVGEGCAGGTSRALTVFADGAVVREGRAHDCGGGEGLVEELDSWIAPVEAQIDLT